MKRSLEKELIQWQKSENRYPLLLRGPRQVGKTYLIEKFGKTSFSSFVSVNFEAEPEAIACFASFDPEEIILRLQMISKQAIEPGKTLLFLDEIQACPQAITALRYFKEKLPQLHVIGAGSLLEFALIQGKFSFPVGRVQFMYLKPFSFYEYLLARGKSLELQELKSCNLQSPPSEKLHREMMKLIKEYFFVGGMPAAISSFCNRFNFDEITQIHEILLSTYQADFAKYTTTAERRYLTTIFDGIFSLIAEQFKYSKIDPHIRSRELKHALNHLEWAGLIQLIYASSASELPLFAHIHRKRFKVIFFDIGLAQHALQIDPDVILTKDLIQINRGAVAEQFVGQELLANMDPHQMARLFFWQREKKGSDAEIDYLFPMHQHIIPIEIKAGSYGRMKSLHQFMQEKQCPIGVRISQHSLSFEKQILSVPFYLISELSQLIESLPNPL